MKKLIKKWLGISELKERADYNEALAKSNKQEIDNLRDFHLHSLAKQVVEQKKEISDIKDVVFKINKKVGDNSVLIEILKDTLDIDMPNKSAPKKAAKKTPPKKVTKK